MILFTAPYKSQSGYGFKSREILKALNEEYHDQLYVAPTVWGSNPNDELDKPENKDLRNIQEASNLTRQPDLHIHVGIPDDFKPHGVRNILFTSGVETNIISPEWIQGLNSVDNLKIVVPSNFVKDVMMNTSYVAEKDGQKREIKLHQEIHVIPESYNPNVFNKLGVNETKELSKIEDGLGDSKFFFTSGQVIPEKMLLDADRKGIQPLLSAFWKMFDKKDNVKLVLKINSVDDSEISVQEYKSVFNDIKLANSKSQEDYDNKAEVLLINGHLSSNVIFALMKHENNLANIYPTRGEGFGRMILEASLSGNRLVIPEVGAFRDFVPESISTFLNGTFQQIPPSASMGKILIPQSKWYEIQKEEIMGILKSLHRSNEDPLNEEEVQKDIDELKSDYSIESIKTRIKEYIADNYTKMVRLNTPTNKKPKLKIPRKK